MTLAIILKAVSPTQHSFTMIFANGGKETLTLDTKTFLYHDFMHFAVESEAKLADSFYGKLAKGYRYDELALPEMSVSASGGDREALMTERIVGLMMGVWKQDASPSAAIAGLHNLLSASEEKTPGWFNELFVIRVKERMRALLGEWKGTPFGSEMRLEFSLL